MSTEKCVKCRGFFPSNRFFKCEEVYCCEHCYIELMHEKERKMYKNDMFISGHKPSMKIFQQRKKGYQIKVRWQK